MEILKTIDVAIAVIQYGQQYLLGFRNSNQHQGNRYEFVGGKVENNETPKQAVIREVYEEIGLDLTEPKGKDNSLINQLGMLHHLYQDNNNFDNNADNSKLIQLHIFRVELSKPQYEALHQQKLGCEGQQLQWVIEEDLLANKYRLPDANRTILQWLKLPNLITITKEIEAVSEEIKAVAEEVEVGLSNSSNHQGHCQFKGLNEQDSRTDLEQQWLTYYQQNLPLQAGVYLRLKQSEISQQARIIMQLVTERPDLKLIIDYKLANYLYQTNKLPKQVIAQHLTQKALNNWDSGSDDASFSPLPITLSSHDQQSIFKANNLAQYLIQHDFEPVIGIFISPVKPTQTHPNAESLGWEKFQLLANSSHIPVIALGGMVPEDLKQVRMHQGDKVAGIRQFLTKAY